MKSTLLLPALLGTLIIVATGCDAVGSNSESAPSPDLRTALEALSESPSIALPPAGVIHMDVDDTTGAEGDSGVLFDTTGAEGFFVVQFDTTGAE